MIARHVSREAMQRIERLVIAAVLLVLGVLVDHAHAAELTLEAGLGRCAFTGSPPGQWWQPEHEHSNALKDDCGEIGVAWPVSVFGAELKLHGRYVSLGRAHTRALARTFAGDDASRANLNADIRRPECNPAFEMDCLYFWTGDGGPKPGFVLSVSHELLRFGRLRLDGEVGAFIHRLSWNNQVYPLDCADTQCSWRITIDQKSGWQVAPMIGATALFELSRADKLDLYVGFRRYYRIGEHVPVTAGIKGPADQWVAGLQKTF